MTKEQLVELVITDIAGGAPPADMDSRYHPLVIAHYIDLVYGGIIFQMSAGSEKYRDWGLLDQYCKPYKNVACAKDNDRDEWYSILPAKVLELPRNGGIRVISPMKEQKSKFWRSDNNSVDVFDELESQQIMDYTSFYREAGMVFYRNFKEAYAETGLLFKLLIPLSEFDDEDEVGIPAQKGFEFIAMVREMLMKRPPEDQVEDNNSKQV